MESSYLSTTRTQEGKRDSKKGSQPAMQFADNREHIVFQRKIQAAANEQQDSIQGKFRTAAPNQTAKVIQAKGDIALSEEEPELTTEEGVAAQQEPDAYVFLSRGVVPAQKKLSENVMKSASYISFEKMIQTEVGEVIEEILQQVEAQGEEGAPQLNPSPEAAQAYVRQDRNELTQNLIEFTSNLLTAKQFGPLAGDGRISFILTIKIQKKYLTKGSSGEMGWIALQNAPYEIVRVKKYDTLVQNDDGIILSEAQIQEAIEDEKVAEFLLKTDSPEGLKAYAESLAPDIKVAKMQELLALRRKRAAETEKEGSYLKDKNSGNSNND